MCGACVYIYIGKGKFFCKLDRNVCIKECWSVFLNACLPTIPIVIVVKFPSFDWSLTLSFCTSSSSSVCRQVSLAVREKEEIQVFQGPLEWREHQDYRASLEAQGLQDPLDLQDQELERESQDFQGEKVECCYFSIIKRHIISNTSWLLNCVRQGRAALGVWGVSLVCQAVLDPQDSQEGREKLETLEEMDSLVVQDTLDRKVEHQSPPHNNFWLKPIGLTLQWYLFCRWKRISRPPWFAFSSVSITVCWERRTWNPWNQWPSWLPWTQR